MKVDYSQAKIYKITNDFNDDIYVGSTCDTLVKRFSTHKADCKKECKSQKPLYKLMNEIGFERFRIELIEKLECVDKYQLRQKEGYHIREIGTLNKLIAGRTRQEYILENKQLLSEKRKEFDLINKEKISEWKKEHRKKNKEIFLEKEKQYREQNKEKLNESVVCECGCNIFKKNLSRHKLSKKHQSLIK
jgi:group I intron endonuclease